MVNDQQQLELMAAAPAAPPSPIPTAALTLLEVLTGGIDVTRYLLKFLSPREQRRLLNTSRQLAEMKQYFLFWKLTKAQSNIFYGQPSFRSQLETLVHDPSQQLCLQLAGPEITDVSCLGSVYSLVLRYSDRITDVSALGGVHTLVLAVNNGIADVSALGTVHTLSLWCCGITDVSALCSVCTLTLQDCPGITDLSALGSVHTLTLQCSGITDVSPLGSVHTLTLQWCKGISDERPGWCAYLDFVILP